MNSPIASKINWAAAIGVAASVAALFGLDISPEVQKMILEAVTLVILPLIMVFRTWFTGTKV